MKRAVQASGLHSSHESTHLQRDKGGPLVLAEGGALGLQVLRHSRACVQWGQGLAGLSQLREAGEPQAESLHMPVNYR